MKIHDIIKKIIPNSLIRHINKIRGTYKASIWFYIKVLNNTNDCFIENEMICVSTVNIDLMRYINKKLKLKLQNIPVNWIEYDKIDMLCDTLKKMDLNVYRECRDKNFTLITISGRLSERDIKRKRKK